MEPKMKLMVQGPENITLRQEAAKEYGLECRKSTSETMLSLTAYSPEGEHIGGSWMMKLTPKQAQQVEVVSWANEIGVVFGETEQVWLIPTFLFVLPPCVICEVSDPRRMTIDEREFFLIMDDTELRRVSETLCTEMITRRQDMPDAWWECGADLPKAEKQKRIKAVHTLLGTYGVLVP